MPMSPYIKRLRAKVGHDLLQVPAVAVLVFDEHRRVLLVRHVEGNVWTTPGGMIEPGEAPADAAVRETWEETGLHVRLTRIIGVFGGEHCRITYANGDEVAWTSTVFEAYPVHGEPTPDHRETLETRFFAPHELERIACRPHLQQVLEAAHRTDVAACFAPAVWGPDAGAQGVEADKDPSEANPGAGKCGDVRPATATDLAASIGFSRRGRMRGPSMVTRPTRP